jgi:hypothetical protein
VHGVHLPYGDERESWWIDASGSIHDQPVAGADHLPCRFFLPGLVDAHAHPAVGAGPAGLVPLDKSAARANLIAWAQTGITLVRDVGSLAGLTLELTSEPGARRDRVPELPPGARLHGVVPTDHGKPGRDG